MKRNLIIAGQFPPPVNGFAYVTQEMSKLLAERHDVTIIDLAPHVPNNGLPYHLRRLLLAFKGIGVLLRAGGGENPKLYVACEGGLGLVYTIMLCACARICGMSMHIHHHSFSYISVRRMLMSWLLRITGDNATHIFLSPLMASSFSDRYKRSIKSKVVSNSAFVHRAAASVSERAPGKPLMLGLLGNLNDEKGLSVFLDVLRQSVSEGLNVRGILAGPPVSERDSQTISTATRDLGDILDYRGPLYGEAKVEFFKSIDVFVFPTRYVNEAQPMVIFEALSCGVPVIAFDRGCIREQVGECGVILPQGEDFAPAVVRWLKKNIANPQYLSQLGLDSHAAFLNDRATARQAVRDIFSP